jgi:menaquinone-dependent protoporphyrinogen oxidase
MSKILIVFSTTDGHTRDICLKLKTVAECDLHQVTIIPVAESDAVDLHSFDKIVIGASIRYGKHNPLVADFINRNKQILEGKPNAFFSVNVVARKPDKNRPETNPYLKKFLRQITLRPQHLGVFAGMINYSLYGPIDRNMIRFIMWITSGPTDLNTVIDFTDWQQVEDFGHLISKM